MIVILVGLIIFGFFLFFKTEAVLKYQYKYLLKGEYTFTKTYIIIMKTAAVFIVVFGVLAILSYYEVL